MGPSSYVVCQPPRTIGRVCAIHYPFSCGSLLAHGEGDSLEEPIPDGSGERLIGRADKGPWSLSAHESGSSHIVVGAGRLALAVWRPAPPPPGADPCTTRSRDRTSREPIRGSTQACLDACARHTDAAFAECDDPDAWPTQGHAGDRCYLGSSKRLWPWTGMVHAQRFEIRLWELGAQSTERELRVVHVPLADAYREARSRPAAGKSRRSIRAIHTQAGGKAKRPCDGGVVVYRHTRPGGTRRNMTSV